jgi:hypothetical protein
MASQKGLGKGLGALLGTFEEDVSGNTPYQVLPIYKVEPNPNQPRQDFDEEELQALADSIAEHGNSSSSKSCLGWKNCRLWRTPLPSTALSSL